MPEGTYAQELPTDGRDYTNNEPYTVDGKYTNGYTVTTYDEYGNVTGGYTFSGWNMGNGRIRENLTISGTWTYTTTTVARHNVVYTWTGLPDQTLYDAANTPTTPSVPDSITGLVNNQPYTIDTTKPGTIVYTRDDYGNTNARYTLSAWTDPNKGTMGDADVTVTAAWEKEDIPVPSYTVTYEYTGSVPASAPEVPAVASYVYNQPVTIAKNPALTGYIFSGWNRGNFNMPARNVVIRGSWSGDFSAIEVTGDSKDYDARETSVTVDGTMRGDEITYYVDGETVSNTFVDVSDSATVTVAITRGDFRFVKTAEIEIRPLELIIETPDAEQVYNGTALTRAGTISGFINNETAEFATTGSQKLVGSSKNTYSLVWNGTAKAANYTIKENLGNLLVTDGTTKNPVTPGDVVNKIHDATQTYNLGDVVTFTITVTNIYNVNKNITIHELPGVSLETDTFGNVAPGETVTTTATYTITEADIRNGSFTNKVTASFSGGKDFENEDKVEELEDPKRELTVIKTVTSKAAAEDGKYALGETISYRVVVRNTGNQTINGIKVEDTKVTLPDAASISLAPGAEKVFTYDYQVTEEDILLQKVVNGVTATSGNNEWSTIEETPTDDPSRQIGVHKEVVSIRVASGENRGKEVTGEDLAAYKAGLGDTISYRITITNNGNQTIKEMTVEDSKVTLRPADATVRDLAPGASKVINYTYTVTEEDIRKGGVNNAVIATDGSNEENKGGDTIVTPTEKANWNMSMTKDVTMIPSRGYFRVGEEAVFVIKVTNTGNQTLENVIVNDTLKGARLTSGDGYTLNADGSATIGTLAIGQSIEVRAAYTVTREDLFNRSFRNTAKATAGTVERTVTSDPVPAGAQGGGSGGGGGGGGGSSTRSPGAGGGAGGPGTVTIDPEAVPLANLPDMGNDDILALIDDEEVPLAALPKTGQTGSAALMLMLSSMMLAAFAVVTRKKEDEQ